MKSFETDIQKYTEKVKLRAAEREELRARILSYMEYHPLPKELKDASVAAAPKFDLAKQPFIVIPFNALYMRLTAAALVLVFVIGVPLAAERSVPGDTLYLVKTKINENVGAAFATSPYKKIEFETRLIERRIAEARLLASEGKLTESVEAEIAETVKGHAEAAQAGIAELKASDADSGVIAEITFSSVLGVQTAVLETQGDAGGAGATTTDSILDVVKVAQAENVAQQGDIAPSYDGLMAQVELETTRAFELQSAIGEVVTEEERADIERRLADIERKIAGAEYVVKLREHEAVAALIEALGMTQKLIAFLTDIDVREHVALQDLVPMVLTMEERSETAHVRIGEVMVMYERIEARLGAADAFSDDAVREKVAEGMIELKRLVDNVIDNLNAGAVDRAEIDLVTAAAFAQDLDAIAEGSASADIDSEVVPEPEIALPTDDTATSSETAAEPVEEILNAETTSDETDLESN